MSGFGDGDIRTRLQEEIDDTVATYCGKTIYDMTIEEKVKFLDELFDVYLHYLYDVLPQ